MKKKIFGLFFTFLISTILFSQDVSLETLLSQTEASLDWDTLGGRGALYANGRRIMFCEGFPWILASGREKIVTDPPKRVNGMLYFSDDFVSQAKSLLSKRAVPEKKGKYSVAAIIIDAGHGGKDPGSIATHVIGKSKVTLVEKDITLQVAKQMERLLKTRYPGRKIVMTRSGDTYPTLENRVEIANTLKLEENEAVIFISIHANASFNKKANGFEVWYLSPDYHRTVLDGSPGSDNSILPILNNMLADEYTTESIIIAKNVLEGMRDTLGAKTQNRGIKAEEWFVVRNAKMPSILVELGFITNTDEATNLSDPAYLKKSAEGIYNGIVDFIGYFEESKGFTE